MTTLPTAEWTQRDDLAALVAALGADRIRWVGGAVRDTLLGNPVKDIDAATPHEPEAVVRLLGDAGIINKGLRAPLAAFRLVTEPWVFLIGKDGKIAQRFEGALSVREMEAAVEKLS